MRDYRDLVNNRERRLILSHAMNGFAMKSPPRKLDPVSVVSRGRLLRTEHERRR